jgi:hypothetical protein
MRPRQGFAKTDAATVSMTLLVEARGLWPKPSARRWRATQNVRKTCIRRILSPVWLGSLQNFVVGIAYHKPPGRKTMKLGGDNSKPWPRVLLSL